MKNKSFTALSESERRSKLARIIKLRTSLSDSEIISTVNKIDPFKQYKILCVTKSEFYPLVTNESTIINQTDTWVERIDKKAKILIDTDNSGVAVITENHVGSLDLAQNDISLTLLLYTEGDSTRTVLENTASEEKPENLLLVNCANSGTSFQQTPPTDAMVGAFVFPYHHRARIEQIVDEAISESGLQYAHRKIKFTNVTPERAKLYCDILDKLIADPYACFYGVHIHEYTKKIFLPAYNELIDLIKNQNINSEFEFQAASIGKKTMPKPDKLRVYLDLEGNYQDIAYLDSLESRYLQIAGLIADCIMYYYSNNRTADDSSGKEIVVNHFIDNRIPEAKLKIKEILPKNKTE